MSPQLIIAAVIAASSFLGGWTLQSWRYGNKEKARVEQVLVDQRKSAATAIRRSDNVIQAQSDAVVREAGLRAAAVGARTALVGLSDATERALRDAESSQAACLERANTLGELLNTMGKAGGELAEKAGRHTNDIQKLEASWPKE